MRCCLEPVAARRPTAHAVAIQLREAALAALRQAADDPTDPMGSARGAAGCGTAACLQPPAWECAACGRPFCAACDEEVHSVRRNRDHQRVARLPLAPAAAAAAAASTGAAADLDLSRARTPPVADNADTSTAVAAPRVLLPVAADIEAPASGSAGIMTSGAAGATPAVRVEQAAADRDQRQMQAAADQATRTGMWECGFGRLRCIVCIVSVQKAPFNLCLCL